MSTIDVDKLILAEDYLVVIPGRTNAEIVRTEKKYDRHFIGTVAKADCEVCQKRTEVYEHDENGKDTLLRIEYKGIKAKSGDTVFYDDSDAVETELNVNGEKQRVEIIYNGSVVAIVKGGE